MIVNWYMWNNREVKQTPKSAKGRLQRWWISKSAKTLHLTTFDIKIVSSLLKISTTVHSIIIDHLHIPYHLHNVSIVNLICLSCQLQTIAKIVLEDISLKLKLVKVVAAKALESISA